MNDNSKILTNSGILYLKLVVTSIFTLFSSRLLLQALGVSDFGLYSVLGSIVIMMNIINNVMVITTFRFITFEIGKINNTAANQVFNISLIIHIGLALLIVAVSELIVHFYIPNYLNVPIYKISDAIFVLRFSVLAAVFTIISIPFQALVIAYENFLVSASIEILSSLLKLIAAIILLFYVGNRLRLYSILISGTMLVSPILFFLYCRKKYSSIVKFSALWDKNKVKEIISFAGWIIFGTTAHVGKLQGSALIINLFFSTILNAAFGIANQVNSLVLMFSRGMGQAIIPQITKSFSSGNHNRTSQLILYISKYSFFLMLLPAIPILLGTEYILHLWLGDVPAYTSTFCRLMIVNALIDSTTAGIPAAVQATGKIKNFQIILGSISLLSLPVAYILFEFGCQPHSILTTYIVSSIIIVVVQLFLLKRLLSFDVKTFIIKSYVKIFYVIVIVAPLYFLRNFFQRSTLCLIIFSLVSVIWSLIVIFSVGVEKSEKTILISTFRRIFNRSPKVNTKCVSL